MACTNKALLFWIGGLTVILVIMYNIRIEHFSYLDHKSKCFSCENQAIAAYGPDGAWLYNPTKGFDDEREAVVQAGGAISGGFLAKTIKYY